MRSVGYKTGLAGVAKLAATGLVTVLMLSAAQASTSGSTGPDVRKPDPWNLPVPTAEDLAQQESATPPAPVPPASAPATPPAAGADQPAPEDVLPDLSPGAQEDFSVGEIPSVEVVELTPELARKALDGVALVHEKYKDAALENYENLQEFVDQDPLGKTFEADLQTFGFKSANEWNIAVTTIGFAYSNLLDDQTTDLKQQIEEVKNDTEMAQDMRDRMVQALSAMIPSDNNRKIVDDLMKDPTYADKLKLLETEEE
ncbi:MAG: hypothetical protein JNM45_15410 [Rhizobiales bacterium]|nr:hypothetical protein [Hyphomicrobiales bacterium]